MWTDGRASGQTDTTKLIVFRNFAEAPNKIGAFADNSVLSVTRLNTKLENLLSDIW
jgi:hypothetical protein